MSVNTTKEIVEILFQHVTNGLLYVDRSGIVRRINERAAEIIGYDIESALGTHVLQINPASKMIDIMEKEIIDKNVEVMVKDRKCISTRVPVYDGKELVGAVAIFDDVTLFEQMNKAHEEDRSEITILKMILELAYDGIIVVNADGIVTMISNAYKKFLGLEDKDVVGKHVTDVVENTRMHMVIKTGIPEINDVQEVRGNYIVATRIPYFKNGKIAGAIGKVLFRNLSELEDINRKLSNIEQELKNYKSELLTLHNSKYDLNSILTNNKKLLHIKNTIPKIAASKSNVLILGESGTGKELIAHAIHASSDRSHMPFVKVNCAAIPENLLESELFGYEKGSFTGAGNTGKMGKFELADNGTLFLDEIGDMPLQMQAKILRALQEGEVERIGSNKPKIVNVRIIAATNRNLREMINQKTFREDLYYRLNVLSVTIPALKERKEDILVIANAMLDELNRTIYKNIKGLSQKTINLLLTHDWPGNVRELKNVIERAYNIIEGEDYIQPWHLPATLSPQVEKREYEPLKVLVEDFEKKMIIDRLICFNGNKTKTAEDLGISRMALHKKLDKYGLK